MSTVYKPQKVFFQGIHLVSKLCLYIVCLKIYMFDVFFSKDAVANKILVNIM